MVHYQGVIVLKRIEVPLTLDLIEAMADEILKYFSAILSLAMKID